MIERVDAALIGGGAVGLAVARSLSASGLSCFVLERNHSCGMETSSRNSQVLHSGLYYNQKLLKTSFCTEGKSMLESYMRERNIPFKTTGKLIVASNATETIRLRKLFENGQRNGLKSLALLTSRADIESLQSNLDCLEAIWSPTTGIFDAASVLQSFESDIQESGSLILTSCRFDKAKVENTFSSSSTSKSLQSVFELNTSRGTFHAKYLINCAGLFASQVARNIAPLNKSFVPKVFYAKGNYFKIDSRKQLFQTLVYPLPHAGSGLGIHATINLDGSVKFGPDIEWLSPSPTDAAVRTAEDSSFEFDSTSEPQIDYSVDDNRSESFRSSVETYWPAIRDYNLSPDYAGVRPKLAGPNASAQSVADFIIQDAAVHGVENLYNLYGIESPGWTSVLSIAEYVQKKIINA
jgi:2-hydroxyglutarate dehydrogenase